MNAPDWNKIKAEYIAGTSYRKLAEKHGVSETTLKKRIKREGWTAARTQKDRKVTAKIVEKTAKAEAERAVTVDSVADDILRQIAMYVAEGMLKDTQSIKQITGALKDIKELKADADEKNINVNVIWEDTLQDFAK